MKYSYIIFGLVLGALLVLLQALHYRVMIRDLSLEVYGSVIAVIFAGIGILLGSSILGKKKPPPAPTPVATPDPASLEESGLSPRELEVLQLMAQGLTNPEIAERLYVSLNTIKTHSSNIYSKLDVKRRTQAVQKAQEMHLIASPIGVKS